MLKKHQGSTQFLYKKISPWHYWQQLKLSNFNFSMKALLILGNKQAADAASLFYICSNLYRTRIKKNLGIEIKIFVRSLILVYKSICSTSPKYRY